MTPFVSSKGGGFQVKVSDVEVEMETESCSGAAIGAVYIYYIMYNIQELIIYYVGLVKELRNTFIF